MNDQDPDQSFREVLLDYLPKDLILAQYKAAKGQETQSGNFASPESSSALVANAFGFFLNRPSLLSLPIPAAFSGKVTSVHLEAEMRFPWAGGTHPWLDVLVETGDTMIGIESKRFEPYRDDNSADFSAAYSRPVWGDSMAPFERMRDQLKSSNEFRFLKAGQLVKHAFGLRTQSSRRGKKAVLCYLYAEPGAFPGGKRISTADRDQHGAEVVKFASEVAGAEVKFETLTYRSLFRYWSVSPDAAAHAAALSSRFDV